MSHPEVTKDTPEAQAPYTALKLARDAADCMRIEMLAVQDLVSVLRAIERDAESTEQIRQLCKVGSRAANVVLATIRELSGEFESVLVLLEAHGSIAEAEEVAHV
ncbi:hypothetical protein L682_26845 [Aquipseudomonas alcaligenes OT 69]|nr:hypothetical protein L682_26845 [Pseudomonas alcaligenes OT 69]